MRLEYFFPIDAFSIRDKNTTGKKNYGCGVLEAVQKNNEFLQAGMYLSLHFMEYFLPRFCH